MKAENVKKVLIALDYDPTAQKVAEMGFSIAKALDAEIILLHVIADPGYYSTLEYSPIMGFNGYLDMSPFQINSVEGLKYASQQFLEKTKIHLGDKNIQTLIAEGDIADLIVESAKDLNADIIVLGSYSREWLESIVMGNVTEKVLHHSTTPLFIVPTKKNS